VFLQLLNTIKKTRNKKERVFKISGKFWGLYKKSQFLKETGIRKKFFVTAYFP